MAPEASDPVSAVLVPGLGLGPESWGPTVTALRRAGTLDGGLVRTVLLPGYGEPDRRRSPLAPDVLARTVVDRLDPHTAVLLVGLSAGCQLAAHVALQAPGRVAALVLVGPTTDPRALTWPRLVRRWVATARSEPVSQLPALVRQYRRTGLGAMVRAMDAARRDRLEDVLARASCPVLLVRGAHDRIAPEDWISALARPEAAGASAWRRSVSLDAGAHMVPFTHGDLVAAAIHEFLADLAG
jgi:pimeloyl-ACP methyl ester carboxylesterase